MGTPGRLTVYLSGTATAATAPATGAFRVWPSPVQRDQPLHLTLPAGLATPSLELRTTLGQVVRCQSMGGAAAEIPTTSLSPGLYLLTLRAPGLAPATRRVVVE